MEIGDTRKATILGVLAVGAIAFLAIRMVPSGAKAAQATSQRVATLVAPVANTEQLPLTLIVDPFSHPGLAPKKEKPSASEILGTKEIGGSLADASADGSMQLNSDSPAADSGQRPVSPGAPGGASPKTDQKISKITLLLTSIVSVDKQVAFISVNNKPAPYRVGQRVVRDVWVKAISEDTVVLSVAGKKKTLKLGQKADL